MHAKSHKPNLATFSRTEPLVYQGRLLCVLLSYHCSFQVSLHRPSWIESFFVCLVLAPISHLKPGSPRRMLGPRHIQSVESNSTVKHYWAYPERVLPCTSDAGTCAYLDAVYNSHVRSMLYTFILWAVIAGVLAFMFSLRHMKSASRRSEIKTPLGRGIDAFGAFGRRWMLAESPLRWLFGRVTILQVTVLSALLGYLLVFS